MGTSVDTLARPISAVVRTKQLAHNIESTAFTEAMQVEVNNLTTGPKGLSGFAEVVAGLHLKHAALLQLQSELDLPIEWSARKHVAEQADRVKDKCDKAEREAKKLEQQIAVRVASMTQGAVFAAKYPLIEIDAIPWTSEKELALIALHLGAASFEIQVTSEYGRQVYAFWTKLEPQLNREAGGLLNRLTEIYAPAIKKRRSFKRDDFKLIYSYPGVIPTTVKAKMQAAKKDFLPGGGFLLMLADAALLTMDEEIIDPDPLIVGYHPTCPDHFWLIDAFDMTKVEEMMTDEALSRFTELHKE